VRLRRKLHGLTVNSPAGAAARDYFSLFQIEPAFAIDQARLQSAYHTLLTQFHPDRFAGKSQAEQRAAAQLCADINSGYRILSDEVTRAEYLLKRAGVDLRLAEREGVGSEFLMEQIMLRERLDALSASDAESANTLLTEINERFAVAQAEFASAADSECWATAARHWQELCYLAKLIEAAHIRGI